MPSVHVPPPAPSPFIGALQPQTPPMLRGHAVVGAVTGSQVEMRRGGRSGGERHERYEERPPERVGLIEAVDDLELDDGSRTVDITSS